MEVCFAQRAGARLGVRRGAFRRHPDLVALAALASLAVVVYALPAAAGYPLVPGDDLVQNLPLRVLASRDLAGGHLPLWDPFIWSGTPLLGGWNAGAAYPLTYLFTFLRPVPGLVATEVLTAITAAWGAFALLRREGVCRAGAFLSAAAFSCSGFFLAQVQDIGFVEAFSWAPWLCWGLSEVAAAPSPRRATVPVGLLGVFGALTLLAGSEWGVVETLLASGVYAAWLLRRGPRPVQTLIGAALGAAVAFAVGSLQILPGLDALNVSQRAHTDYAFWSAGSLTFRELLLGVDPVALGGGSPLMPAYQGPYLLPALSWFEGVLPLAAALALAVPRRLARLVAARSRPAAPSGPRARRSNGSAGAPASPVAPSAAPWLALGALGLVLALGSTTPLGHVLASIPLYGKTRLQNENLGVVDLALAMLLGHFVHRLLSGPAGRRTWSRAGAACGPLLVVAAVVVTFAGSGISSGLFGASLPSSERDSLIPVWAVLLVLACACGVAVALAPRLPRARAGMVLATLTLAGIAFQILTGPLGLVSADRVSADGSGTEKLARLLASGGRFAVYDPGQVSSALAAPWEGTLAAADRNVYRSLPSVQGYGALTGAGYAAATDTRNPGALAPSLLDGPTAAAFDLRVLLVPASYLSAALPAGHPAPHGAASPTAAQGWLLGRVVPASRIALDVQGRPSSSAALGIVGPSGRISWLPTTDNGSELQAEAPGSPLAGIVVRGLGRARAGVPVVTSGKQSWTVPDGEPVLSPYQWAPAGEVAGMAAFVNRSPSSEAPLKVLGPSGSPVAARFSGVRRGPEGIEQVTVVSPAAGLLVRSEAFAPGWTATVRRSDHAPRSVAVESRDSLQAVPVPAGRTVVTWRYDPPGLRSALPLAAAGIAVLLAAFVGVPFWGRRSRRSAATKTAGPRRQDSPALVPNMDNGAVDQPA